MRRFIGLQALVPILITMAVAGASAQRPLRLTLPPGGPERVFTITNARDAFYAVVANGENSSGFHGITRAKRKVFENHWIALDGRLLDRRNAEVTVEPDRCVRRYPESGTEEVLRFCDSLCLLVVSVTTRHTGSVTVVPSWSAAFAAATHATSGARLLLRGEETASCATVFLSGAPHRGSWEPVDHGLTDQIPATTRGHMPAMYRIDKLPAGARITFAVQIHDAASAPDDARSLDPVPTRSTDRLARVWNMQHERFSASYDGSESLIRRGGQGWQGAEGWIRAAMSSLLLRGDVPAVWAGLPWFDEEWGRDTFLALPGAVLGAGDHDAAKRILSSFIRWQNTSAADPNFGRIPNRIQPGNVIYNTADGTPLFVRQAWSYLEQSGDTPFASVLLPAVDRAIEGVLRHHSDSLGFLTHADADTWMDAVGPRGPWSPRGNRAVEIQALWIDQLESSARIALLAGDTTRAEKWRARRARIITEFLRHFTDPATGTLVDHLNSDGSRDTQLRPNVLLTLTLPHWSIIPDSTAARTLDRIVRSCVYSYGVASLAQSDARFHPWHVYPAGYPKDAAYHNGTIWTWLTGPAVTALVRSGKADAAWKLTAALEVLARDQGAIGTLPECTDALTRGNNTAPRWSGTFSQAWSTAEYLRNLREDYCGVSVHALDSIPEVSIRPQLPSALIAANTVCRVGAHNVHIALSAPSIDTLRIHCRLATVGRVRIRCAPPWTADSRADTVVTIDGPSTAQFEFFAPTGYRASAEQDVPWCIPRLDSTLASIRPPSWPIISPERALKKNRAASVLFEASDPAGDDAGAEGTYTYPRAAVFPKGIFDLRSVRISADETDVYFRLTFSALSQPGWHPEYGFQLTMVAIGIDQSADPSRQTRSMRANSRYTLPPGAGCDKIVLVGGGVEVRSADDRILGAFVPTEPAHAFGSVRDASIEFAIPRSILGQPHPEWQYHILVGAQDDHGGAGIGEFRDVLDIESAWNGGGNHQGGSNVYDELHSVFPAPKRAAPKRR